MDIVERLRGGKSAGGYWREKEAADEIERLQLREETLSGIIDGMTARFIEAQGAVEEIERLREALQHIRSLATTPVRQIRLRSILEQCVWFVNAALKEGE